MAWIVGAGPLILWLAWELRRLTQRQLLIRRAEGRIPPYSWPLRSDFTPEIYEPHELAAVSRILHRRYLWESVRFDANATIGASLASLGFPTLRYRHDSRLPEYLFLIDRASFRDHQSHLYEHLAAMLRVSGLHLSVWFFEGDPRVCWSQTGDESVHVEHLQRTCHDHRVLLFGTGDQLLDAVTGLLLPWCRVFAHWTDRAILTPVPVSGWGARELTLATQFAVVPATLEGLATLGAYFELPQALERQRGDQHTTSDVSLAAAEIDALRRYLGADLFQWVCACAVYPELQWGLTLSLAALPAMAAGLVSEENLTRLLQLEWFRAGSIPDNRRRELIAHLDPQIEREVREAIVGVVEQSPALAGSFAAGAHEFQIAYQRSRLAPKDRKARRALKSALRNMPPSEMLSDYTYLDAAELVSRSPLHLVLPRRLRRLFYPAGLPWLGMRSIVRLVLTLIVVTGALGSLRILDRSIPPTARAQTADMQPPTPAVPVEQPTTTTSGPSPITVPPTTIAPVKPPRSVRPSPPAPAAAAASVPASQPEPSPGPQGPEAAIRDLLARYKSALESRSLESLKSLWPSLTGLQETAIRKEFESVEGIELTIENVQITATSGTGTVRFIRRYAVMLPDGKRARIDSVTTMEIREDGGSWVIERMRFEGIR